MAAAKGPTFKLEDQFEKIHDQRALFGKRSKKFVVVVGGDKRKSGEALDVWVEKLAAAHGSRLRIYGYVDLEAVPFFVPNASIRRAIKKQTPVVPVLCDWDGEYRAAFGFAKDTLVGLRLYSASGQLLGKVEGSYSSARMKRFGALLRSKLASKKGKTSTGKPARSVAREKSDRDGAP